MNKIRKYAKGLLALIGGLTPAAVVGALALFDVRLDLGTVTALLGGLSPVLAGLLTILGPRNVEIPPESPQSLQDSWTDPA